MHEVQLCGMGSITFQDDKTACFGEYIYIKPKNNSGVFKMSDIFIPQIQLIREKGFHKAICKSRSYKLGIKRYFKKMTKVKTLKDIVIFNDNAYGVYLHKEKENAR